MSAVVLNYPSFLGATPTRTAPNYFEIPEPEKEPEPVESKKSNHQANIVRISEVLPHPDPDTTNLELIIIGGYQVVIRKGGFMPGDLGVYIQPDSVVPQTEPFRFIWEQYVGIDGTVPEKRRRITVRKFRGQWSEGLLLPVTDFHELHVAGEPIVREGDDVSDLLGITHYDPDTGTENTRGNQVAAPRRKYPKTLKGWFFWLLFSLGFRKYRKNFAQEVSFYLPEYDVESFKNRSNTFEDGETVIVTEKIHGSNARFVCIDNIMYAGSRTQWKAANSDTIWSKALAAIPWIETWCRAHPGYALYGEVTPTQKGFDYGSKQVNFFLFDVLKPDGSWADMGEYDDLDITPDESNGDFGAPDVMVPVLYIGPYSKEIVLSLVDGPSLVPGAKHIREGVVVKTILENGRTSHRGRKQLKVVSNRFLEKDSKS